MILLSACAGPQRLAREFADKMELPAILFISDPNILIEFYRPDEPGDSLNFFKPEKISYFLDDTLLSDVISVYNNVFVESMRKKGFRVYESDAITQFFENSVEMWQLSPVQFSFEEHRIRMFDELSFTDYSIFFDTIISEYQFNVWIELNPVNGDSTVPSHLFFTSSNISDRIKGRFVYDWMKRIHRYSYDFIEVNAFSFYILTANAANSHASYLYDYFLNRYLYFHYSKSHKLKYYYSYDWNKRRIVPAKDKRFVFL